MAAILSISLLYAENLSSVVVSVKVSCGCGCLVDEVDEDMPGRMVNIAKISTTRRMALRMGLKVNYSSADISSSCWTLLALAYTGIDLLVTP